MIINNYWSRLTKKRKWFVSGRADQLFAEAEVWGFYHSVTMLVFYWTELVDWNPGFGKDFLKRNVWSERMIICRGYFHKNFTGLPFSEIFNWNKVRNKKKILYVKIRQNFCFKTYFKQLCICVKNWVNYFELEGWALTYDSTTTECGKA